MKKKNTSVNNSQKSQSKTNPLNRSKNPEKLNKNNKSSTKGQTTNNKNKQNTIISTKKSKNEIQNEEKHELKEIKLHSKLLENNHYNDDYTYQELSSGLNNDLFLPEDLKKNQLLKNKKNAKTIQSYYVIDINLKQIYNFLGHLEYQKLLYLFEEISGLSNENNNVSNNNKLFTEQITLKQITTFIEKKNIFGEKVTIGEIEKMFNSLIDGSKNKNFINYEQYIFLLCEIGKKIHYYEKDDLMILKHLCDNELKNINVLNENMLSKYDRFYFMLADENCNSLIKQKYLTPLKNLFGLNVDKSGLYNINNFITLCQKKNIIPDLLTIKEIIDIIRFIRSKKNNTFINNSMDIKFFIEVILLMGFVIYDKYLNIYKEKEKEKEKMNLQKSQPKHKKTSKSSKNTKVYKSKIYDVYKIGISDKKPLKKQNENEKDEEISDSINNNVNGNKEEEEEYIFDEKEKNRILKFYEGENIEKDERKFVKQNERLEIILDYILGK